MQNMQGIHETVIRDIVDVIQGIKDSDEVKHVSNYKDKTSWRSIASRSEALTMVFPVLVSRNISYQAAAMISKAIERKAVLMLQMLFAAVNITDAKDGIDYISRFHKNLDAGALTVDKFLDTMDAFVEENGLITEAAQYEEYEKIKRDLRNINFYFENNVNDDSLSSYKMITVEGKQLLIHEAAPEPTEDDKENKYKMLDGLKDYYDIERSKSTIEKNKADVEKTAMEYITRQLLDGDVKKANELVPTMMYVNFVTIDNATPITSSMVVGVKAKLYAVDSQDIINRIKIKHNDKNTLLNLVKAGTREISFFRDFVFAIDRAKIDALSQSRRGSSNKIWKVLERRAIKSKLRRTLFMNNDAAAITTLVISQEEVEYLKKTEYINLENPKVVNPILDAYNLMCFVVVDESLEIAKFLFDTGDDMYEILTFDHLEREAKDNSKKIINLMSKLAR